jgi:hypothetical protein
MSAPAPAGGGSPWRKLPFGRGPPARAPPPVPAKNAKKEEEEDDLPPEMPMEIKMKLSSKLSFAPKGTARSLAFPTSLARCCGPACPPFRYY